MMKHGLLVICFFLAGCKQENLLQSLEQRQANEVVAVLHRNNIDATKKNNGKNGFSVDVGQVDFAAAVDILKVYDLPSPKAIEVADMFPADSLVASPRAEKARLYSAIEQRLEQSLKTVSGVVSTRVHVSYDLDGAERGQKNRPVHLSTLIVYDEEINPETMINNTKRFLKNSFDQVEYDNISVILSKRPTLQNQTPKNPRAQDYRLPTTWLGIITVLLLTVIAGLLWHFNRRGSPSAVRAPLIVQELEDAQSINTSSDAASPLRTTPDQMVRVEPQKLVDGHG
ncbi:EscJ/YscJ/HrcJ family type III secretion inner membrane ring protein [Glaciimonas sp. Gout2]|uniref:EscJ/YscJ/HrcJ family type III secretion inner membrane ring protein n=1 Tax=unclassified Glaciimonas TaxID=2644401 RepID=UPI002B22BAA9|nr:MULTISPECIES: EscJ/YscJ/HrcJ family type III secretion inner membrane ring protein [unclassified Glaciimonas]MEB0010308.1 EscJ/YscJ/HrcJ family type III secretion inner membrane ring protein [Glaciimonas sp. Cout2]MEB0084773.1 EscJ/YscJ/HrcJ family type III secretion inner membrane ring protein [Glaciimonas sp. Gout2]